MTCFEIYGESLCQRVPGPDRLLDKFHDIDLMSCDTRLRRVVEFLKSKGKVVIRRGSVRVTITHDDRALASAFAAFAFDTRFARAVEELLSSFAMESEIFDAPIGVSWLACVERDDAGGKRVTPPSLDVHQCASMFGATISLTAAANDDVPNETSAKAAVGAARRALIALLGAQTAARAFVHVAAAGKLEFCLQMLAHEAHRAAHKALFVARGFRHRQEKYDGRSW